MSASPEVLVESRIERVEVYARGAVVTRRLTLPAVLPPDCLLVAGGVTPLAEPGSLRADVVLKEGVRQLKGLRSRLVLPAAADRSGPLTERVRELERVREHLVESRRRLRERRDGLARLELEPHVLDKREERFVDPAQRVRDAIAAGLLAGQVGGELEARLQQIEAAMRQNARELAAASLALAQGATQEREGSGRPQREVLVLLGGDGLVDQIEITYGVAAARWWPVYAARFSDGGGVELSLEAQVTQAAGEDWRDVAIALSTADLVRDVQLPVLPSLRLGRAQPPARSGYRPPPPGLDQLYAGYDAAMAGAAPSTVPPSGLADVGGSNRDDDEGRDTGEFRRAKTAGRDLDLDEDEDQDEEAPAIGEEQVLLESEVHDKFGSAFREEPTGEHTVVAPRRRVGAAKMPRPTVAAAPGSPPMVAESLARGEGGGAVMSRESSRDDRGLPHGGKARSPRQRDLEPDSSWLEFDCLMLGPMSRGRLELEPERWDARGQALARVEACPAPLHGVDPRGGRGSFDHRYAGGSRVDVPADARAHRIPIARAAAPSRARLITVPRHAPEVFREALVDSPFDAPLLGGPIDVYVGGGLLATSLLQPIDRGGVLRIALGVEERVRVARNVRVEESAAGMLGGSTMVEHAVTVELRSSLGFSTMLEVLDVVPVTDLKDVEVGLTADPAPEKYDQADRGEVLRGGYRWRVEVPPGGTALLAYRYRIKFPAKGEIVGGNRRE